MAAELMVEPLAGAIGAEVSGVDLSSPLDPPLVARIREELLKYGVIFFRDQVLSIEQHKRFASYFGRPFVHPNFVHDGPNPEVVDIRREPGDTRIVGEEWHADATMLPEPPAIAILYGVEIPPYGGDTLFSSQYAAYESLSPAMRELIGQLRALHSDRRAAGPRVGKDANERRATKVRTDSDWKETITSHPVVRVHPETGRPTLFVNESYTYTFEGMTEAESQPLLRYLIAHGDRPEFTCRFRWRTGSLAMWDNRCTKHLALHDTGPFRRVMRRIHVV